MCGLPIVAIKRYEENSISPCTYECMQKFIASAQCSLKMRYCGSCCELCFSTQSAVCPRFIHSQPDSVVVMRSLNPYTWFDRQGDDEQWSIYHCPWLATSCELSSQLGRKPKKITKFKKIKIHRLGQTSSLYWIFKGCWVRKWTLYWAPHHSFTVFWPDFCSR